MPTKTNKRKQTELVISDWDQNHIDCVRYCKDLDAIGCQEWNTPGSGCLVESTATVVMSSVTHDP